MRNTTDYVFPETWGLMDPEQRSVWYDSCRALRQAQRQITVTGRQWKFEQFR